MERFVFFITRVGEKGTQERSRADDVHDYIVVPIAKGLDLTVVRSDRESKPGQITAQIIRNITRCAVVVADLTGRNPNVYYELGVAHSFRKPVVILADKADSLSFDAQNERVIQIGDDGTINVSQAEAAKKELGEALNIVVADGYTPENLVTIAATAQTFDELAAEDPSSAILQSIRDQLERNGKLLRSMVGNSEMVFDYKSLERLVERMAAEGVLDRNQLALLVDDRTSQPFDLWVQELETISALANPIGESGPDEAPF